MMDVFTVPTHYPIELSVYVKLLHLVACLVARIRYIFRDFGNIDNSHNNGSRPLKIFVGQVQNIFDSSNDLGLTVQFSR